MSAKIRRRSITWDEALEAYDLQLRARRAAKGTLDDHRLYLGYVRAHFDRLGLEPAAITVQHLRAYQAGLFAGTNAPSKKPLSARTVGNVTSKLRRFFSFLVQDEFLASDPTARLEQPRCPRNPVGDVLTEKEVERLLAAAPDTAIGQRDRTLIEVLYATGLRRAELLALDLGDLDHDHRDLIVRRGKGGKGRRVPVTRTAWGALTEYLADARATFVTKHPDSVVAVFLSQWGRRMNHMGLTRALRGLVTAAGIKGKKVSPHTFRRSFATALLQGGASLRAIQLLLGHTDLSTTAVYLRLDTSELRREVLLKHPRERMA